MRQEKARGDGCEMSICQCLYAYADTHRDNDEEAEKREYGEDSEVSLVLPTACRHSWSEQEMCSGALHIHAPLTDVSSL